MRIAFLVALVLATGAARAHDIIEVLQRSHETRLASLTPADPGSVKAKIVRASFEQVLRALRFDRPVSLRIVGGPLLAETLAGEVVVVNESLADMPENARRFILAHELGHVAMRHWSQMGSLFQKWVPGEVTPQRTEPVAQLLGRDASGLAHRQEFEADAYAARTLNAMGGTPRDALDVFMHLGGLGETATHPSVKKRIAALRELDLPPTRHEVAEASLARTLHPALR